MFEEQPLVTVGLPVYNGEATLDRALGALVRQNYENLEIVIGDNGSEDRTEETRFTRVQFDESTIWPQDFDPPPSTPLADR